MAPPPDVLAQGPTLVIDAATARTQVGLLERGEWSAFEEHEGEVLETIFSAVSSVLEKSSRALPDIRNIAFGVGPGSILGLRLSLMALLTWRQMPANAHWECFQFHGLVLHAQLHQKTTGEREFHLISGFRRGSWHLLSTSGGEVGPLRVGTDEEISALRGRVYCLPSGRHSFQAPPVETVRHDFSLKRLPELLSTLWAKPVEEPVLYLPAPSRFKEWDARRHR